MDWTIVAALLFGSFFAGFVNIVAGGGSLITVPILIFAGVPPGVANGTTRVAIFVQNLVATIRYQRQHAIAWRQTAFAAGPVLTGALAGAWLSAGLDDASFKRLFAWITLGAALPVAIDFNALLARAGRTRAPPPRWVGVLALSAAGFFGGIVQAGVGFVLLAAFTLARGLPLVPANVQKVVMVMLYSPLAIAPFVLAGRVELSYAAVLTAGQAAGAWVGAGLTLTRGESLIRAVTAVVIALSAIGLLRSG